MYYCCDSWLYLSVVQFEGGVVVMGMVVDPLVHHCHMAIDLLSAFLQRPILSTLPPAALVCPAAQNHKTLIFKSILASQLSQT